MHCYKTLIAVTRVARIINQIQGTEHNSYPATIAEWMEISGLEIEDAVEADYETLSAQVAALLDRENRKRLRLAA